MKPALRSRSISRSLISRSILGLFGLGLVFLCHLSSPASSSAGDLTVAVDRWLEVRNLTGTVFYQNTQGRSRAQIGTRMQAVGDTMQTLDGSAVRLAIDTGTGFVNLSENTTLRIQALESRGGGRLTRLKVLSGQARLTVRPFTHPESGLEVETPAGWSGVRGTEFGVAVRPDGTTGIATLEGSVEAQAQGQSVTINNNFQSLIISGEPPLPPIPLTENTQLDIENMSREGELAYLLGSVDPVNLLLIEGEAQQVDADGRFEVRVPIPEEARIKVVVITPLGKRQAYELGLF